ncbi:unnamed protein product [Aureobasidium pullulans]|nr:unnamed protein product [Aureobasidium pullulans]
MATSQFPSRPFTGLGRASTVGQQQQQQQVPNQQQNLQSQQHQQQPPQNTSAYPVPSYAGPSNTYNGGAGAAGPGQREAVARAERERLERERREAEERAVALKALGFDLPKQDLLSLLSTHGIPASAPQNPSHTSTNKPTFSGPTRLLLPHSSFLSIAATRILSRDPRDEILRAFDLFDTDGKGAINLGDLRRVARELGEGLQEEELVAMIEEFDLDGDGAISRDEFVGICLG